MARAQDEYHSLRFSRRESARVTVALLLSLLAHLLFWGTYYTGEKQGLWKKLHAPAWLRFIKKSELQAQFRHDSQPTIFVDVSRADADAPTQTRFYSNKNSRAANPDVAAANTPRINGKQQDMPKTETVPRAVRAQQPAPPSETKESQETAKEEAKADAKETPKEAAKSDTTDVSKLQPSMPPPTLAGADAPKTAGDLDAQTKSKAAPAAAARPRTLRQALAQRDQLPGLAIQQPGGVARRAIAPSLDVKATQFGDYDRELIEAVQQRWDELLDNHRYADDRNGKVVLQFKLKPDGSVIEMQTTGNSVGELLGYLCQEAIEEAAPFAKWPPDMVRMIGANYREITFTFYYY
jgi:hypothetical protein